MPLLPGDSRPPDRLDHYELIREIGRGRTSTVYEAIDRGLRRTVALRVLAPDLASSPDRVWQFVAQAATAARVAHHNATAVFFIGQQNGYAFCAREFAACGTLTSNRERIHRADIREAIETASQILEGLAAAHAIGIVHGNLHPGNVLFDDDRRRVLLSDFQGEPAGAVDSTSLSSGFVRDLNDVGMLLESLVDLRASTSVDPTTQTAASRDALLDAFCKFVQRLRRNEAPDGFRSAGDASDTFRQLRIDFHLEAEQETTYPALVDHGPRNPTIENERQSISIGSLPPLPESVIALDRWVRRHPRQEKSATQSRPADADLREEATLIERAISDVRRRRGWLEQFDSYAGSSRQPSAAIDDEPVEQSIFLPDEDLSTASLRRSLDSALDRLLARQESLRYSFSRRQAGDRFRTHKILLVIGLFGWMLWLLANAFNLSPRVALDAVRQRILSRNLYFPEDSGSYSLNSGPKLGWVPEAMTRPPARELRSPFSLKINGIEFCPGRAIVAAGADDGTVHFLLAETGQHLRSFLNVNYQSASPVNAIGFSPDGRRLAVAGAANTRCLQIIDVASGRVSQNMRGDMTRALSVGFSFDGRFLGALIDAGHFSANRRTIVLFDVETGEIVEKLPESDEGIEELLFAPTMPLVALFGRGRAVTVWDYTEHRVVYSLPVAERQVSSLAFSPDGVQLAAGTTDGHLLMWDLKSPATPRVLRPDRGSTIQDVVFSPDGRHLALIGGGIARIWDCSRESIARYFVTGNQLASFSSDGRFLATVGGDNFPALIWDVADLTNPTSSSDSPKLSDEEVAGRHCRHLLSIRQANNDDFRKNVVAAAKSYPRVLVPTGDGAPLWQEVTLNSAGLGFDGLRFSSPLSMPADLNWAFNVSAAFEDCGIVCIGGAPLKLRTLQAESNLHVPEIRLLKNNGIYFHELTGGALQPGKEYVIWFQLNTTEPVNLSFALHVRPATPGPVKESTTAEIAAAMRWKLPFSRTAREYLDTERLEPVLRDLFDFEARPPFSSSLLPTTPLEEFVTPPDYPRRRRTVLRRPQP